MVSGLPFSRGDLSFFEDGSHFIWTSQRSGFRHIYLYAKNGKMVRQITSGNWPVAESGRGGGGVKAVDEAGGYVYFSGWTVTPNEQHLFRAPLDKPGEVTRLTETGGWHTALVAPDGSFFVDNGQSPSRPPYSAIRDRNGTLLTYITENALDEDHPYYIYQASHRPTEFGVITTDDGIDLQYALTLPTDFDPAQQYPAIVFLYGGPGGAPVVDWRLYDTHYTERYMGNPSDGDAYKRSNPISYVDGLRGNLLLVHGMADDNVFFDNSVKLMAAMQKAGKQFELMTYPGKRHGINGEAERTHLNTMRLDFFKRHLQP